MNPPAYRPLDDEGDRASFAERWLETALAGQPPPALLLVIGLAEGDLLDALDRRAPDTRVLALEPDPAMAQAFLASGRWETWMRTGRLTYLTDPDYAGHEQAWRVVSGAATYKVLTHPASSAGAEGSVRAARTLKNIVFGARANADARRKLAPRYLVNSLRNVPAMLRGSDVRALAEAYQGVPALITAAGPSLDAVIDRLPAMRDRALLIATDTTLRPLLHAGIAPQLVVGLDPSHLNARHFLSLPECGNTWLVSESALDRRATAVFGDRVFWFRAGNHQPWPLLNELGMQAAVLEVWGSVLTGAFQVACLAGCDPIVIVGADLAFTGGRPYARGTTYEFDWAWHLGRGGTLDEAWRTQIERRELHEVDDLHGERTRTTASLLSFRDWMVARAQASGRRVINATGAGLLFGPAIEQLPLPAALPYRVDVPAVEPFARRASNVRPAAVARRLRQVQRSLDAGELSSKPLSEWVAFTAGAFDREEVGAALDEAAHMVETRRGATRHDSLIPWHRLAASHGGDLLIRLPELTARWHALLTAPGQARDSEAGDSAACDRRSALHTAFDLLSSIARALSRNDDLAPLNDPAHLMTMPVSAVYSLPNEVQWAVQTLEALLGAVTGVIPAPHEVPFLAAPVSPRDAIPAETAPQEHTIPAGAASPDGSVCCARSAIAPRARRLERPLENLTHSQGSWPFETSGGVTEPTADARPHATYVCLHLAIRLLRCCRQGGAHTSSGGDHMVERLRAIAQRVISLAGESMAGERAATLVLTRDGSPAVEIPLGIGEHWLVRALTGSAAVPPSDSWSVGFIDTAEIRIGASVTTRPRRTARTDPVSGFTIATRFLSDEGLARGSACYSVAGGAVCVMPDTHDSFVVGEDGSVRSFITWPRAITGQLPLGSSGAVAWSWGESGVADGAPPYVMYREHPDDAVTVEPLPFRPSRGAWWRNRLYWTCVPLGIGSWAPGGMVRHELTDLSLAHAQPAGDGLLLVPRVRRADGAVARRLLREGWRWNGVDAPVPVPLGPHGVASCTATHDGWTAVAHLEADLVAVTSPSEVTTWIACYQPVRAIWAGRSLVVSTPDHELLLFQDLIGALEGRQPRVDAA